MKLTSTGAKHIKEVPYGVYLWQMPNGSFVSDGEGHFLMIAGMEGDQQRMKTLAEAARNCGVYEGMPCFFSGNRIVTDEEYEYQKTRLKFGLIPDPLDVGANREERDVRSRRR